MKCEEIKLELPGLLWGELSENEREEVLKHLSSCESCRNEWKELKAVEAVMTDVVEENPPSDLVFMNNPHSPGVIERIWQWITSPGVQQWGFAAAVVMIALAVAKPSLSIGDGGFSLSFGGKIAAQNIYTQAELDTKLELQKAETLKLVSDAIELASDDQRRDFTLTLAAFARDIEKQRHEDITWMQAGMTNIQRSSQTDIMRTNQVVEDLIKTASYQQGR